MSITIDHRFINRLLPTSNDKISTVIIGTFNPGIPDRELLSESEQIQFERIENSPKFNKFNEVLNFYDRPQNRFWKIHDCFNDQVFYSSNIIKSRNPQGLKYYRRGGASRQSVFERQLKYCKTSEIFITDFVRRIRPKTFDSIYDNFPDSIIEQCDCDWNTTDLLKSLEKASPKTIIINFKITRQIPRLSKEVIKIRDAFGDRFVHVLSTSGAAGYSYEELVADWGKYLNN